jgi:hypothetical protein
MRPAILAITLVACTRADEEPKPPPEPAPDRPAVRPADKLDFDAELTRLAKQLVDVTFAGCRFVVSHDRELESRRTIPLDEVTWSLDTDNKRMVVASCRKQHGRCIWTVSESRTTDLPHVYMKDHRQVEWDRLDVTADVKDLAKLVAELDRAARFCKQP